MSSILTNTSAMVALQTMRSINKNLADTQSQISTGKSVATARDNAAVWSISRTMESDVKGFKAISSSLALGSSTVGVARQAAETVTDLLTQMKGRIVAAQEENVDRGKIQTDIVALREQIQSVVGAAQFNGLNLLTSDDPVNVLSSLDRSGTGVTASSITVASQNLGSENSAITGAFSTVGATPTPLNTLAASVIDTGTFDVRIGTPAAVAGSQIILNIGDRQISYTVTAADVTNGGTPVENIAAGLRNAIQSSGIALSSPEVVEDLTADPPVVGVDAVSGIALALDGDTLTITNNTGAELAMTARASGPGAGGLSDLAAIDVSDAVGAQAALGNIEALIQTSISAAAAFGSAQMRIDTQAEFVKNLTDSLTTGIGSLVDADLEATSARLQALQVQQQLATQSLSIANQQPQNILALFR
ncbi:MAG: flagellin N-terminal helical domain-containing protein [Roseinatronobacter sp.]